VAEYNFSSMVLNSVTKGGEEEEEIINLNKFRNHRDGAGGPGSRTRPL
jgi:hypothetical protein